MSSADMLLKQKPPSPVLCPQSRSAPSWFWPTASPEFEKMGMTADILKEKVEEINSISETTFVETFNTVYRWLVYLGPIGIVVGIILVFALWEVRTFYVSIVIIFPSVVAVLGGFMMLHKEYNNATDLAIKKVQEYVEMTVNAEYKGKGIRFSMETEVVQGARGYTFNWNHIAITIDRTQIAPAVAGIPADTEMHPIPLPSPTMSQQNGAAHPSPLVVPKGSPMAGSVSHSTPL